MIIRVVSGLVVRDGKILMGKRPANKMRGGLWETPGGKVEPGESPIHALVREWHEEVGVQINVGPLIAVCAFDLEVSFFVELYSIKISGEPKALDHSELAWVPPRAAVKFWPCSPGFYAHYPQIRSYFRNVLGNGGAV